VKTIESKQSFVALFNVKLSLWLCSILGKMREMGKAWWRVKEEKLKF
jgi:hypothetical protein